MPKPKTATKTIRGINLEHWAKFKALCALESKSISRKLNELIKQATAKAKGE